MCFEISSWYLCAFKMPSIKCTSVRCPYHTHVHTITPPPPWATWFTTLTSANCSPTRRHTRCLPSAMYSENRDSSVKRTPLQSARSHRMWVFAHSSRLRRRTAVKSSPRWGRRACRWAFLRRFLKVCAEILWLCKPIVAAAVWVAGLRRSWRWRCWMWRSWVGVVTRGLRLWGRLDALTNSLKGLMVETAYGREMNIQFTGNSSGGHSCSQHANCTLPQNLQHLWHCAIVIKLHILEWAFIVASLKVRSHQMQMKHYAQIIYMLSQCKDTIDNRAALFARMRRREWRELRCANWAFDEPFTRIARVEKSELWRIFPDLYIHLRTFTKTGIHFATRLELPGRSPSHDAYSRLLCSEFHARMVRITHVNEASKLKMFKRPTTCE